jgi:hypothetical protein
MKTTRLVLMSVLAMGIAFTSCKKKKNNEEQPTISSGYFVGLKTESAGVEAEYVLTTADLMSGTISANGIGTEQLGWMYYHKTAGSKYMAFDYTNNVCTGYTLNNGAIQEAGSFIYDRVDVIGNLPNGNVIGIGAPWGGGSYDTKIQTIDPNSMSITNTVNHPLYTLYDDTLAQLNMWPTHTFVDGDKLYVSFYPLHGASWQTDRTDTAYVSVFSYPGMVYQTTFKDSRTSPIGYYGGSPCIFTDENGDHYTFSSSSLAAGFTQSTKPSGILKINSGATAFNSSYFFNIENFGYRLLTGTYVGNGKVVARVVSTGNDGTMWGAFSVDNPICKLAVIDLYSQNFTIVNDVPLHGGQYFTPFLVEDGKVYASINNGSTAHVYRIDPATATATQGALIDGNQLQAFFKF